MALEDVTQHLVPATDTALEIIHSEQCWTMLRVEEMDGHVHV